MTIRFIFAALVVAVAWIMTGLVIIFAISHGVSSWVVLIFCFPVALGVHSGDDVEAGKTKEDQKKS